MPRPTTTAVVYTITPGACAATESNRCRSRDRYTPPSTSDCCLVGSTRRMGPRSTDSSDGLKRLRLRRLSGGRLRRAVSPGERLAGARRTMRAVRCRRDPSVCMAHGHVTNRCNGGSCRRVGLGAHRAGPRAEHEKNVDRPLNSQHPLVVAAAVEALSSADETRARAKIQAAQAQSLRMPSGCSSKIPGYSNVQVAADISVNRRSKTCTLYGKISKDYPDR